MNMQIYNINLNLNITMNNGDAPNNLYQGIPSSREELKNNNNIHSQFEGQQVDPFADDFD